GPEVFSNGNRNDELGLPLALGELAPGQRTAVLELAAASGAELMRLGELVQPDALILTAGAPPEAQDAPSLALRDGLGGLLDSVPPGGLIVLNGDDADLARQLAAAGEAIPRRLLRYGLGPDADVAGAVLEESAAGSVIDLRYGEATVRVRLQAPGRGAVDAALAAAAMAVACGYMLGEVAARLDALPPEPGRLAPLAGRDGLTVLDDSFSASAASLRLALATLATFPPPHRAALGEIAGVRHAEDLDAETLQRLLALDRLVLQGRELVALGRELRSRAAEPQRIVLTYSSRDSADAVAEPYSPAEWPSPPAPLPSGSSDRIEELGEGRASATLLTPQPGVAISPSPRIGRKGRGMRATSGLHRRGEGAGTVLVKGTDAARMERVVELLLPEAGRGGARLVRQDEGWRRRTYVPGERPTWVEVDLEAIRRNLLAIRAAAAPADVMAVLKADAYGHGARWVARTAALNGATMLGVASLNEALELRADGIATPILILGYAPPWQARDLALSDIRATLFSLPVAEHFSRVARDLGRAIAVHIKVDTGMTRLGVLPPDVPDFVDAVAALPGLRLEGIFSHMATSDSDVPFAMEQGERFNAVLRELERRGHRFRYVHMENSAAVLRGLPFAGNLVRAGLALYGLYPLPREETAVELHPAMQFKTRVAQVKEVPPGTAISYGRTYVTERTSRIAILPVGYGDGFRRSPRNWGHVLVRGQRAPIR
ncbi:MAG TPA: alanine racemase, partial [Dehalococcoidia bacterium]|nr:alanine racemase [Dehalococcoidia bacterium]